MKEKVAMMRNVFRPPLFYFSIMGMSLGLLLAGIFSLFPLGLEWGHRVAGGLIIIGVYGALAFRVWPPTCFALESSVMIIKDFSLTIAKSFGKESDRKKIRATTKIPWVLVAATLTWPLSAFLHHWEMRHDPPIPVPTGLRQNDLTPIWQQWLPSNVVYTTGHEAFWNPWRQHMVIGTQWNPQDAVSLHVLAHELTHSQQSLGRTRGADGWIKVAFILSSVTTFVIPWTWLLPAVTAIATIIGDMVLRWPLELRADTAATQRLSTLTDEPAEEHALIVWGAFLVRRRRRMLWWESVGWAALAAIGSLGVHVFVH